jgi:hypothetical protein
MRAILLVDGQRDPAELVQHLGLGDGGSGLAVQLEAIAQGNGGGVVLAGSPVGDADVRGLRRP